MAMFLVNDAKYDIMAEAFVSKYGNPNAKFTFQGAGGKGSIVLRPELSGLLPTFVRERNSACSPTTGMSWSGLGPGVSR